MDPVYFTDDYPRAGCVLVIDVQADRCSLGITAPGGKTIEQYAYVPHAEMPRMVEEWLSGKAPRLRAQSISGSTVTV